MFENDIITHHIGRSIIRHLLFHEYARFSEMRPPKVDTNLFTYHLKLLIKQGYIKKTASGYMLDQKGLMYVDRVNAEQVRPRTQPKIITMLLVQDGYGKVLLQKRSKQPYINTWTLPYGKLHIDDESVLAAARREANEKLFFDPRKLRHVGDGYITVVGSQMVTKPVSAKAGDLVEDETLHISSMRAPIIESKTFVHIVRFETDAITASDTLEWVEPLDLAKRPLAPAVEQIVTRAFFGDDFFFEEFICSR